MINDKKFGYIYIYIEIATGNQSLKKRHTIFFKCLSWVICPICPLLIGLHLGDIYGHLGSFGFYGGHLEYFWLSLDMIGGNWEHFGMIYP